MQMSERVYKVRSDFGLGNCFFDPRNFIHTAKHIFEDDEPVVYTVYGVVFLNERKYVATFEPDNTRVDYMISTRPVADETVVIGRKLDFATSCPQDGYSFPVTIYSRFPHTKIYKYRVFLSDNSTTIRYEDFQTEPGNSGSMITLEQPAEFGPYYARYHSEERILGMHRSRERGVVAPQVIAGL